MGVLIKRILLDKADAWDMFAEGAFGGKRYGNGDRECQLSADKREDSEDCRRHVQVVSVSSLRGMRDMPK